VSAGIAYEIRAGTYSSPQDVADALRAVSPDASFRADFTLAKMKTSAKLARYTLESVLEMVWYTGWHGKTASTSISNRPE